MKKRELFDTFHAERAFVLECLDEAEAQDLLPRRTYLEAREIPGVDMDFDIELYDPLFVGME